MCSSANGPQKELKNVVHLLTIPKNSEEYKIKHDEEQVQLIASENAYRTKLADYLEPQPNVVKERNKNSCNR